MGRKCGIGKAWFSRGRDARDMGDKRTLLRGITGCPAPGAQPKRQARDSRCPIVVGDKLRGNDNGVAWQVYCLTGVGWEVMVVSVVLSLQNTY